MNKILKIVLSILIVITIISTASYCSAPYDTETTHKVSIQKTIEGGGYILRNETVVETPNEGIFEANLKDGDRTAKGVSLGIFTSGNLDKTLATKLADVTKRINEIKQSDSISALYTSDEARIFSAMKNLGEEIRANCRDNDFIAASETTRQLGFLVAKKDSIENASADDQLLLTLEAEKYDLEQKLGGVREEIFAPASGYYYSELDGLENIYEESDLSLTTTETIANYEKTLKNFEPKSNSGKIVDSFVWYLAATVPVKDTENVKTGDSVTVSIDNSVFVKAEIIAINTDLSDNAAIVLKSDRAVPGIYEKRTARFEICYAEYTGLYVPSAAIRVSNDVTGVYVMNRNNNIEFKCANVLLKEESYYIVSDKYTPPEDCPYKALSNYDNILVNPEVTNLVKKSEKKS